MTRFFIGLGLMLALLALGLFNAYGIEATQAPISATLEQAAAAQDPAQAEALLNQARSHWQQHRNMTAALADHAPMEEIEGLLAQAQAYVQGGRMTDFSALCLRLSHLLQATTDSQQLSWRNFL